MVSKAITDTKKSPYQNQIPAAHITGKHTSNLTITDNVNISIIMRFMYQQYKKSVK